MRTLVAILALSLGACGAQPEAVEQIASISSECSTAADCNDFVTRKEVDRESFLDVEIRSEKKSNPKIEKLLSDISLNGAVPSHPKKVKPPVLEASSQIESVADLLQEIQKSQEGFFQTHHANTLLICKGIAKQGGLVVCQTTPNARVEVGRSENDTYTQTADKNGVLLVGFDRDEPAAFIRVGDARIDFDIKPREYDTSRIDGLPKKFVSEYTAEQLKQIRAASALKKVGFASKVEEIGFENGFIYPVTEHIKTTNFGAQRILNGDPKRPHFGVDLAAPKGTPILAPADGIVSLASEEMYFEGSLIMIDHGQGLISYYLHNEDVMVEEGQRVVQGEQIGTVGSRGRSTGPHLCWRLKWRGRNLDPELLTTWPVKDAQ